MLMLPPLSLYVHIPWCIKKCPYCDFNSHTSTQVIPEKAYITALLDDLAQQQGYIQGRTIQSIFIGGGTPSLFSGKSMSELLEGINQQLTLSANCEITLEANPGSSEQNKFLDFRSAGINRLSLGVQSFNAGHLTRLGRAHSSQEAHTAINAAQQAGFTSINIDLMHGLPDQKTDNALDDLATAIAYNPQHLSWYQLTIEPNTIFYSQPPTIPVEDTLAEIQDEGQALLAKHGFTQYEVSAYSQAQSQSRHNLNYWQFGDYIGIGAGAHSKITQLSNRQIYRRWQTRLPEDYLNPEKTYVAGERLLTEDELPLEFMMNVLRLNDGAPSVFFSQRTGLDLTKTLPTLKQLQQRGLIARSDQSLKTTPLGHRFLNEVLEFF